MQLGQARAGTATRLKGTWDINHSQSEVTEDLAKRLKVQRANLVSTGMKILFPLSGVTLWPRSASARRDTERSL